MPDLSVTARTKLDPGDVMLVGTDGRRSGGEDKELALVGDEGTSVEQALRGLADRAVANKSPHSDNTSVTAVRWRGA